MPNPFIGLAALAVLYIFCLIVSFLVSLIYSERGKGEQVEQPTEQPEKQPPEEKVFYFERVSRRRRKKHNKTIAIRGKLIDDEKTPTAE